MKTERVKNFYYPCNKFGKKNGLEKHFGAVRMECRKQQ